MIGDTLTREDLKKLVSKVIAAAEAMSLPSRSYAWHRRFVLGIDPSIDAADRRSRDTSITKLTSLHKSAEMTLYWLRAQEESDPSERELLLGAARQIFEALS